MNLLMFVAVGGAIAIGQYAEPATVAFLFSVSLMLESWSVIAADTGASLLVVFNGLRLLQTRDQNVGRP